MRMVLEHKGEYDSQGAASGPVATKLGMTAETLDKWVRRAETDGGLRSATWFTETIQQPAEGGSVDRTWAREGARGRYLAATASY